MKESPEQEFAKKLMSMVNGYSTSELQEALVEAILHDHRTLQGYAIRLMRNVLTDIGEKAKKGEIGTDLRNEGAVKWCKALAESEDNHLRDGISVC